MSRMAVPKMKVVRFKENDVIVASGINGLLLEKFNNGTNQDATVDGFHIVDYVEILRRTHGHAEVFFRFDSNQAVNAEDLLDNEENNSLLDGIYTRSEENGNIMWTWQQQ